MAVSSRARTTDHHLQASKHWKDREISPERTKVWTEPNNPNLKTQRKVPVVYYLSRDGQLEHPHFMEVPLSSSDGLYLKDVINRLISLRGKAMASLYSWSSKRSYKNGFVWHDLTENDFIYPAHGQEYVLKGSELHDHDGGSTSFRTQEAVSSIKSPESHRSGEECDFPVVSRRRNQSWSALDLHEYKVYKAESAGEYAGKAADASTQTDDKRRRRRSIREEEEEREGEGEEKISSFQEQQQQTTELSREEISPPPSNSSPETLETLIKADGSIIALSRGRDVPSGRMKASSVLMQLISCGSFSAKDFGVAGKEHGLSLISQYRTRLPRGPPNQVGKEMMESPSPSPSPMNTMGNPSFAGIQLEDKEYFSGSLIETKKHDFAALKRSSSYNADRGSKLDLREKEIEGVRAKCMPRRPRMSSSLYKKDKGKDQDNISNNTNASEAAKEA